MGNSSNIRIEPCDVSWGDYQVSKVTCAADIASSHNNDYFYLYSALDAVKYYVWMNVGGAGVDPAPGGGAVGIEVDFAANASASTVASAVAAALALNKNFYASASGSEVTVTNAQPGISTTPSTGVGLVGFTYSVPTPGSLDDLGLLEGDIEVSFDEKLFEVKSHQTGSDILAALRQGKASSVKLTIQETHLSNMQLLIKQAGASYTPMSGTEVVGWGSGTNSINVVTKSKKLILHPHALSGSDKSRDMAFWLAYLNPKSIKFSGENPLKVECDFKVFTDIKRKSNVDLFVYGDHTQDFKI